MGWCHINSRGSELENFSELNFGLEIKSFYFRTISEKMSFFQPPNVGLLPNQMDKVTVMNFSSTNVLTQTIHHSRLFKMVTLDSFNSVSKCSNGKLKWIKSI